MQNENITIKEGDTRRSWDIEEENRAEVLKEYFNMTINI